MPIHFYPFSYCLRKHFKSNIKLLLEKKLEVFEVIYNLLCFQAKYLRKTFLRVIKQTLNKFFLKYNM